MTGAQHKVIGVAAGFAASAIVSTTTGDNTAWFMLFTSGIGCMLPDIDHNNSRLGSKRKKVTNGIKLIIKVGAVVSVTLFIFGIVRSGFNIVQMIPMLVFIGVAALLYYISKFDIIRWSAAHRGIMHTLLPGLAILFLHMVNKDVVWRMAVNGLALGYISHLLADMLTIAGCPVLFPITQKRIRLLHLRTNTSVCNIMAYVIAIILVSVGIKFL